MASFRNLMIGDVWELEDDEHKSESWEVLRLEPSANGQRVLIEFGLVSGEPVLGSTVIPQDAVAHRRVPDNPLDDFNVGLDEQWPVRSVAPNEEDDSNV